MYGNRLVLADSCQWEFALKRYTCSEKISNDYVKSDIYIYIYWEHFQSIHRNSDLTNVE